jgi:UDP-N-acetylmuramoyl-tripeptide--D-alanyl-D-alanine ligase
METQTLYEKLKETSFIFSTDTRTVVNGDIFVGIKGDVFDGNLYCKEALEKGASYVISTNPENNDDPRIITVTDPLKTLQDIATMYRKEFTIPILVIGGSNGKTTTKELTHAVLSKKFNVHTTKGNLNNHIGVPLTLLSMHKDAEIAVIEIGANHPGEHTLLMNIVKPTHVLVTNNGADHLEGFMTLEGVRKANKEIFDELGSGTAFVSKQKLDLMEDSSHTTQVLYPTAEYTSTSSLLASLYYKNISFTSELFGALNEANILAAITVGEYFSVPHLDIASAISKYKPSLKRSQIIQKEDHTIIMDCYNANPTSMELSLRDFFSTTKGKERITIVGDMFEVGEKESEEHLSILKFISENIAQNDICIVVGKRFFKHKELFPYSFFITTDEASSFYQTLSPKGKYVYLKASRGTQLENVIQKFS